MNFDKVLTSLTVLIFLLLLVVTVMSETYGDYVGTAMMIGVLLITPMFLLTSVYPHLQNTIFVTWLSIPVFLSFYLSFPRYDIENRDFQESFKIYKKNDEFELAKKFASLSFRDINTYSEYRNSFHNFEEFFKKQNEPDSVLSLINIGIEKFTNRPYFYYLRSHFHEKRKSYDLAIKDYEIFLNNTGNPNDYHLVYRLNLYYDSGEKRKACEEAKILVDKGSRKAFSFWKENCNN